MAFTDLHEEIEEMFSAMSGHTEKIQFDRGYRLCGKVYKGPRPGPKRSPEETRSAKTEWMRAWRKARGPGARANEYAERARKDRTFKEKEAARHRQRRAEMTPEQLEALRAYKRVHEDNRRKLGRPVTYEGRAGTNAERVRRHREKKGAARGVH